MRKFKNRGCVSTDFLNTMQPKNELVRILNSNGSLNNIDFIRALYAVFPELTAKFGDITNLSTIQLTTEDLVVYTKLIANTIKCEDIECPNVVKHIKAGSGIKITKVDDTYTISLT